MCSAFRPGHRGARDPVRRVPRYCRPGAVGADMAHSQEIRRSAGSGVLRRCAGRAAAGSPFGEQEAAAAVVRGRRGPGPAGSVPCGRGAEHGRLLSEPAAPESRATAFSFGIGPGPEDEGPGHVRGGGAPQCVPAPYRRHATVLWPLRQPGRKTIARGPGRAGRGRLQPHNAPDCPFERRKMLSEKVCEVDNRGEGKAPMSRSWTRRAPRSPGLGFGSGRPPRGRGGLPATPDRACVPRATPARAG